MNVTCSKCGKQISELFCPDCSSHNTTTRQKLLTFAKTYLLPITLSLLTAYISIKFINPPKQPAIDSTCIYNTGISPKVSTSFHLDLTTDKTPWVTFTIKNSGSAEDDDLVFKLSLPVNNNITNVQKNYYPPALEDRADQCKRNNNSFSQRFGTFPSDSAVEYRFDLDSFPDSIENIKWSLISKSKNWTNKTTLSTKRQTLSFAFTGTAFAAEIDSSDRVSSSTTPSHSKTVSNTDVVKSGISLGGYDPVVMSNGLFQLIQSKNLISHDEAFQLKNQLDASKDGVLFAGVNVLKFCELIINALVNKNIVTHERALRIIETSKTAQGVLIGGYNVIVLEVEILNSLLENKHITFAEGQKIIDQSKH